jgi:hypothetical protein
MQLIGQQHTRTGGNQVQVSLPLSTYFIHTETNFIPALRYCERLINLIHNAQLAMTGIKKAVRTKARGSEFLRSGPWCELKHYLDRWHSYRQAANFIVCAAAAWPLLFQDFTITSLPSSTRISKPIVQSDLTAVAIVQHMEAFEKVKMPELMQDAEDLRRMGLDKAIQIQLLKRTFRPIVHAEVLIHHYLTKNGITRPNRFWRQWQYIGASKPTCRLCHYYFSSHSQSHLQVRPSHLNLYPNWRLPEISDEDDAEAREAHRKLLKSIAERCPMTRSGLYSRGPSKASNMTQIPTLLHRDTLRGDQSQQILMVPSIARLIAAVGERVSLWSKNNI